MRRACLLLLVILTWPARAEIFPQGIHFDSRLAASVLSTALAFLVPRTLEPVPLPQLAIWGLRGLTALDPQLTAELRPDSLRLISPDRVIFSAPLPAEDDVDGWARAVAAMARAASDASEPVRRAGTQGVLQSFFDELFNHLDPYSRYVPPAQADTDRERRNGEAGIGVSLASRGGAIVVREVTPESPADQAGIGPGDQILGVDGQRTRGQDAATIADLISGPEDSTVLLQLRGRNRRVRSIQVVRAIVVPQTVFASAAGDVLTLRISAFASDTDLRLQHELERGMKGRRLRGIILDLRGNRGGLLRQAVAAADLLVAGGTIVTTAGRNPQATRIWRATTGDAANGLPVVVVVDGRSASAAEIFAAALADLGRGVVVGSVTLGKGLVQTISPLPDAGELFVTWSRVLAPRGWPLQGLGVLPQLCTSLGAEATARQEADLAAGIQDMARAIAREREARAPVPAAQAQEIRSACPPEEGREGDMEAARFLLANPSAYATGLMPP